MQKPIVTAKDELIHLISDLKRRNIHINTAELITILVKLKDIFKNKRLIDVIINAVKLLMGRPFPNPKKLTPREQQVLFLIGEGLRTSDIALKLNISTSTAETHRKNIRKKLKIQAKDHLIVVALIYNLTTSHSV
ncbi:helix-turn-helix transcriptional regulator [uncultured Winogradskyella sp.]|uniref:response regulator transcription factor n=1 Tax=uncultured Winogradskyella sp. TaxID=395353 RepID=UPI002616C6CA|nr:helix-turn-helix transcriptional regulator [uncultured Winogradskyella sp.]